MLDKRKQLILQAIVDDYITSAEPVGSRTLARKYNLGVSPATIRNEMADLEMLGYLEHIHTSSGRIPSSKGYRFYVDGLTRPKPVTDEEKAIIQKWYEQRVRRIDEVFQETARIISKVTKNVSLVLAPQLSQASFRCLQFLPLDDHRAIAVLLTDAGFVENRIVDMPDGAELQDFQRIAGVINSRLGGCNISMLQQSAIRQIKDDVNDEQLFEATMEVISRALENHKKERLYLGGTREIMEQPEFRNVDKIKDILLMLEKEELVRDILHAHMGDGLEVSIGKENNCDDIQDCSIITATYHLDGELLGKIAVLGPTRMEYAKAMSLLEYMNTNIAEVIKKFRW